MNKQVFDYSKTLMAKIGIGNPDNKGGCTIINTFAQALEKIKIADALTLGIPKIVYLVGWQYNGHDDGYPAFFEVNQHVKRPEDKTALDSLLWLKNEAKKYHTTISLHINLSDAYKTSPLWDDYMKNNLILLNSKGEPKITGTWNSRTSYQVRFGEEYDSGFFKKRVDQLLSLYPLSEVGTVHVDAFFVRKGKDTTIQGEKDARRKMIEYFNSKGVDVTSEFIYREKNYGYRSLWGKSDTVGLIPAVWNLRMTQRDYIKYPPSLLAGGRICDDLQWDKDLKYLFYQNMQTEPFFSKDDFTEDFNEGFCLETLPYMYMNCHKLQKISGMLKGRKAYFSGGVVTSVKNKTIMENSVILKENETLCMPAVWLNDTYVAYSKTDCQKDFCVPFKEVNIYNISSDEMHFLEKKSIINGKLNMKLEAGKAYKIVKR